MSLSRCELCLENQPRSPNDDSLAHKKCLENIVYKLFSLSVKITDRSTHICMECNRFLGDCVKFYDKVQNAHHKILETNIKMVEIPFVKKEVSLSPVNIKKYESITYKKDLHLKAECEYLPEPSEDDNFECVNPSETVGEVEVQNADHKILETNIKMVEIPFVKQEVSLSPVNIKQYESITYKCEYLPELPEDDNFECVNPSEIVGEESQDLCTNNLVESQNGSEECSTKIRALKEKHFPSVLFNNGKLIPKGKALNNLLNKFYNLFCDRCHVSPTFKSVTEMFEHHKTRHNVRGYVKCCDSKLHDRRQIALHMARHLQPSAFECPVCKKFVSRPDALKSHMQSYHLPESEKPYKCDQCEKSYAYLGILTLHKSKHLPEKEKKVYECKVCQKRFTIQTSYSTHVSTAHSTDKFVCAVCGKSFKVKSPYLYHLKTHERSGTKNIQCQVCDFMCASNQTFIIHMKRHGPKNYSCEQCLATYYTSKHLRHHMKVKHTDLKPFKCSLCTKNFRIKQNLNDHMAQHTGEQKYECEHCLRKFSSRGNYYTHKKRMHPEYKNKLKTQNLQSAV